MKRNKTPRVARDFVLMPTRMYVYIVIHERSVPFADDSFLTDSGLVPLDNR